MTVDWFTLVPWATSFFALGAAAPIAQRSLRDAYERRKNRRVEEDRLAKLRQEDREEPSDSRKITLQKFDVRLPGRQTGSPYLYLTQLRLNDFRCFSEARIDFRYPEEGSGLRYPNVNLLLGDNGTGKSSVLRAAAMVALGPLLNSSGFVPYRLVRQGAAESRVAGALAFGGPDRPVQLVSDVVTSRRGDIEQIDAATAGPYWSELFDESSPSFFVVAYGVNRRVADISNAEPSLERGRRRRRYQRVSSLFDDSVALVPFGAWLPVAEKSRQREVRDALGGLLPKGAEFTGRFEGEQPIFCRHGLEIPFRALSDGLQSYIGWLGDLFFQLDAVAPHRFALRDVGGLVMVDEIDLLLHPSWQRVVVATVSEMFPNIQFIFTTHSPIVTGTLEAANITVAEEITETGSSSLRTIDAEVFGLNAEQVLLSSYFDLPSTRSPDATPALEDLARRAVDGDDSDRQRYLEALTKGFSSGQMRE